jgi:hypothetical protein
MLPGGKMSDVTILARLRECEIIRFVRPRDPGEPRTLPGIRDMAEEVR